MSPSEKLQVEKSAVDTLLDHGVKVKVGWLRINIQQSYLGTLLHLSRIYAEIAIDEDKFKDSALTGSYLLVPGNAERLAKIIAIASLNSLLKIKLFSAILSKYLLWKLTPEKLFSIVSIILVLNNTGAFTNSIRLIHTLRMTSPKKSLVEEKQGD